MAKNLMDLTGRVVAVIGGTSGIGRKLAAGLAEAGATVVPTGRREQMVEEVCDRGRAVRRQDAAQSLRHRFARIRGRLPRRHSG